MRVENFFEGGETFNLFRVVTSILSNVVEMMMRSSSAFTCILNRNKCFFKITFLQQEFYTKNNDGVRALQAIYMFYVDMSEAS